jgi:hypothetical protein
MGKGPDVGAASGGVGAVKIRRVYRSSVVCREWCLAQPPTIVRQIEVEGVNQTGCMHSRIKAMINNYKLVKYQRI